MTSCLYCVNPDCRQAGDELSAAFDCQLFLDPRKELERVRAEVKRKSGAFEHACRMQREAQDALSVQLKINEPNYIRALIAEARAERLVEALKTLQAWKTPAVLGDGNYAKGLLCGVEDRGLQTDGYEAMRYGYDRAIERVAEEIDATIEAALADQPAPVDKAALAAFPCPPDQPGKPKSPSYEKGA